MTPTISERAGMADRRRNREPGRNACKRVRSLPILPDVVEWLASGFTGAEVARRIQANGYLTDVPFDLLRREIIRFCKTVAPEAVLQTRQLSRIQERAESVLEQAIRELPELAELYRIQKTLFCQAAGMSTAPGTVASGACVQSGASNETTPDASRSARTALDEKPVLPQDTRPLTFHELVQLMVEMRQTLTLHARIRQRLNTLSGGTGPTSPADQLARVLDARLPGRADVNAVLLNPQRRTRVLGLLHEFLTSHQQPADPE